ncbi:hypothetical protein MMC14_000707 [Varicellaria rhodocarpa]|nr:hypothetical protein [Varicellaria rhodocarpa]
MFGLLQSTHSRRKRLKELGCMEPPDYPHKDPIFGLDVFFDNIKNLKNRRFLDGFKTRFDLYGETFRAIRMGTTSIYTNDPKNYQAVHALQFSDYGVQPLRRDATLPFLGEGVFTMDGPFWEHSREIIRPTFARSNVTNLPAFEAHFRKFLELIPRDSSTVDLKPLLYRLFFDTSTEFLLGESMNTLSLATLFQTQRFLDAFHYAQRGIGTRMQMGMFKFLYRDRKWDESIKITHAFADRYVDKALEYRQDHFAKNEDINKRYVLLQEIVKKTDDRIELRSQIIHVFLAGHDSTAITIGNAIFHLCRHQYMWEKLRAEVLATEGAPLTFGALKNMRYLQYIVKETLRLHPVAPTDSRVAYRDTVLPTGGGPTGTSPILVSKGQIVTSSFHALHRRKETWGDDVEQFRPE